MKAQQFFAHRWLSLLVRIVLGVIFIAAAVPKIQDPPSFAHMIYNYRLVPGSAIHVMALVLPWLEFLCGLTLIIGFWKKTASIMMGLMLLVFTIALSINLARDFPVNCGCFQVNAAVRSHEEMIAEMKWDVARDIGLLLLCVQAVIASNFKPLLVE